MTKYGIWSEFQLEILTKEEKVLLLTKLSEFQPMILDHLIKRIKNIGTKYP